MPARGKFITVEGVDGAGKSSHLQFIADLAGGKGAGTAAPGRHVIVTREPGGTDLAERLRKSILEEPMAPLAEALLLFAARTDHVQKVIAPALAAGSWVVSDRFTDATLAYQGAGKGVPEDLIRRLAQAVHAGLAPDRTLVFDCPYDIARERLAGSGRSLDRFEREERAFHERVRNAYLALARAEPARIRIVDASGDFAGVRKALERELSGL
ncbi:MAG: dTMP kinase [Betaproteobacteria bacterium]|nr:dTMP kinase [Betaproteobacteria bacterium]